MMLHRLFVQYSLTELRHHPWRSLLAVLAIALGVALGFGVHLINQSALSEFSQAVRSINGEPDIELRAANGALDEKLYPMLANDARIKTASPVIEIDTYAKMNDAKLLVKIIGIDPLVAASLSPALIARSAEGADSFALFADDAVFLSGKAMMQLNAKASDTVLLQSGTQLLPFRVAGTVGASEAAIAVMDIAAAQAQFAMLGQLSRIDVALAPGAQWRDIEVSLQQQGIAAQSLRAIRPGDGQARISNLSRAYRVNLTVLALVALFTGGFLVFSIQAMTVAQRTPQLALLGILGADHSSLRLIIWSESLLLGIVGAISGILLGTLLAALALQLLGGDLGGGYFAGVTPSLQFSFAAALAYAVLGIICALLGGWLPAAQASRLSLVSALKASALSSSSHATLHPLLKPGLIALALMAFSLALAVAPPIAALGGLPYLAYIAIALLLVGGVVAVPALLPLVMLLVPQRWQQHAIGLLALQRATHYRQQATVAICGVVASLSLAVALTVMVASFRDSVTSWLDSVLPAELYARSAPLQSAQSAGFFTQGDMATLRQLPDIERVEGLRYTSVALPERMPSDAQPLALIARNFAEANDPARTLPLVGELVPAQAGAINVYASEAAAELYGLKPGVRFVLPLATPTNALVRGVWRDYARQTGALTMSLEDFARITQDTRVNDVAMWLHKGATENAVEQSIRSAIPGGAQLEFASSREIRKVSLTIFDRSFAVTVWLQVLAIGIGLFGIAASFSAQVLARRKEFGMLIHLGYTRRQLLLMVAAEGAAWTLVGALLGVALGLAVSVVLVHVVNPQSFHWTMEMHVPWHRLLWLGLAVIAAGCITALWAARQAAGREAVLAVRADW